jgi:signal transduction histidine kinase
MGAVIQRSRKLIPVIALATALAMLLATIALVVFVDRAERGEQADATTVRASILASTVTAALAFNDREAANEYVHALAADPAVRAAAVYDEGGAVFASYARYPDESPPARIASSGLREVSDGLSVVAPVLQNGKALGSAYLEITTQPWPRRLQRYGVIAVVAVMASLIVGVLGFAQAALARANLELESRARELSSANENLRSEMEKRAKAEEALRHAQKMEAIGQLTGGVAHDFNNLLQVILGNLDVLRRRTLESQSELRRPVEAAIRGADRAAKLTQNLLAFARRQPLAPKPIDVNRLIAGMSDFLRQTLGETIRIQSVLGAGLWAVAADANQLETALLNLAVNSRHAMGEGDRFVIETSNTRLEANPAEEEVGAGDYVLIAVTDTGIGMSADVASRAFDPFFTTKETGKGSGLGLSQVYGFLRQSGGHATIESALGHGTTVKLYLPRLMEAEPIGDSAVETRAAPHARSDELILVVEDNEDVRDGTVGMLRELGYRVVAAEDGTEALRLLDGESGVRLLFTDVGLPGAMNGRQLADAAKRIRPQLLVLFTTGYARDALMHDGRLDPGLELIGKPFTYATLAAKLRYMLDAAPDRMQMSGPR